MKTLKSIFTPDRHTYSKALQSWIERLLKIILRVLVVFGTPLLVTNLINFYTNGWIFSIILIVLSYIIISFIAFFPQTPYRIRVHTLIWVTYILSLISFSMFGLSGDGRVWAVFTTLFATILIGVRFGMLMVVINLSTYAIFGLGMTTGFIPVPAVEIQANSASVEGWVTTGFMQLFTIAASSYTVGRLINKLNDNLEELQQSNEQLKLLNQQLISLQEYERATLSRDLHDEILNSLAVFTLDINKDTPHEKVLNQIQKLSHQIRHIVNGLRPPFLDFGLSVGLDQLVDTLGERLKNSNNYIKIQFNISSNDTRFDPDTELHIYRIIQQGCENAIRHADASDISVSGEINPEEIQITITDNGIGMQSENFNNLTNLLSNRQFGLANMQERALLIDASVDITSKLGAGTTISLNWKPTPKLFNPIHQ